MSSTFRALKNRNYRLWVSGTVVSNTGTWIQRTAQDWLVLTELTKHSGLAVGVTTGLQFAPLLLLSAHAGVLADRLPKRHILAITQTVMGLSALALGLLTITHVVQLWQVFACALVLGIGSAFDSPARQALASEVVPRKDVTSAVSLNSASMNVARLIGPGVAGILIADFGTGPAFLINAASFAAVLVSLIRMRASDMFAVSRAPRGKGQVREGLRYAKSRPDLMLIFFMAGFASIFAYNFQITNALMASGPYHRGPREYGLLGSTMAIGCLCAAFLAARREKPRLKLLLGSAGAVGLLMSIASQMPDYQLYALMLIPIGLFSITFINSASTTMQLSTPPEMRGRILALWVVVFQGSTPIGAPIVGWIGGEFGARWSVLVGGLATLLAAAIGAVFLRTHPHVGETFSREITAQADASAAQLTLSAAR
jgi:MFS family permease